MNTENLPFDAALLRSSQEAVFILGENGVLLWENPSGATLLDAACKNKTRSPLSLLPPTADTSFFSLSPALQFPCTVLRPEGASSAVLSRIILRKEHDTPIYYFVTIAPGKLDESRVSKERRAFATITHDLKNPLSAVMGYAELLTDTSFGDGLPEVQRMLLAKIRATTLRSLDLLKNYHILLLTEDKGVPRATRATDLQEALTNAVQQNWRADPTTAPLTLDLCPQRILVYIDTVYLDRIFSNLISNAVKYTPATGSIHVSCTTTPEGIAVHVINSDPLLLEEDRKRIFLPYERGEQKDRVPGSGLGLSIVKSLMEAVGGEVQLTVTSNKAQESSLHSPTPASDLFKSSPYSGNKHSENKQGNDFCVTFPAALQG